MSEPLTVDFKRLSADVEELAQIGRKGDRGLFRMAFTPEWQRACKWLTNKLVQAGLETKRDEALNVIGRLGDGDSACVMTGSHLDTVPGGGHLDGALGVVVGLECLRRLKELEVPLHRPVELVAFNDEEGRFGGMFGSQAMAGQLTPEFLWGAVDAAGTKLSEQLQELGLEPLQALRAQRPARSIHSFVELHIEQGPVLDAEGVHVGAVSAIVGLRRWQARLIGQANHAGTTPMRMRHDALRGLAEVVIGIDGLLEQEGGPHSVVTIGRVELKPGAANVIPGVAEFSVDIRDVTQEQLDCLTSKLRELISHIARARGLRFEFEPVSDLQPVTCARRLVDLISGAAHALGHTAYELPSGAAHDTQTMASITDVGMIFVPSLSGRSHSAAEWTSYESIEVGANTLLNVLARLAQENQEDAPA